MVTADHLLLCARCISATATPRCRHYYYYSHFTDEKLKLIYINQLVQSQICSILWSELQISAFNPSLATLHLQLPGCIFQSLCAFISTSW